MFHITIFCKDGSFQILKLTKVQKDIITKEWARSIVGDSNFLSLHIERL